MSVSGSILVLKSLIEKAVRDNSQPNGKPSSTQEANLRQYFERKETVDIVYDAVLARAETNAQNAMVVQHCIRLLKNVSIHIPSDPILRKIDSFCVKVENGPHCDAIARQSLVSIRAVVSRTNTTAKLSASTAAASSPSAVHRHQRTSVDYREDPSTHNAAWKGQSGDKVVQDMAITNFLSLRRPAEDVGNLTLLPTLYHCVHFGGQFRRNLTQPTTPSGFPDEGTIALTDVDTVRDRIQDVGFAKRSREVQTYKEDGLLTVRRKKAGMTQYKMYVDQAPLNISPSLLAETMQCVLEKPVDLQGVERRQVACKVLIKAFLDLYTKNDPLETEKILIFLLDLVAKPQLDSRMIALSLIFNLSLHAHILCDPSSEGGRARIIAVQDDLYKKLCEVLLALYQTGSSDAKLWGSAYNVWMYFVAEDCGRCDSPRLSKPRLLKVDPRVYVAFVDNLYQMGDSVVRTSVRALVNALYPVSQALDVGRLERVGGPSTIIRIYVNARSDEVIENLFVVLFDYVVHRMGERKQLSPSTMQVQLAFELLKVYRAPRLLVDIFKYVPEKFVENFVRFAFFDQLKKTKGLTSLSDLLDKKLIVTLLYDIEKLAMKHLRLAPVYYDVGFKHLVTIGEGIDGEGAKHLSIIPQLLRSTRYKDRLQGEVYIHALLQTIHAGTASPWLTEQVNSIIDKLATSDDPLSRRSYLNITERIILVHRSKIVSYADEQRLDIILRTLNDKLLKIVQVKETDQTNLLRMIDIIMSLVAVRHDPLSVNDGLGEPVVDSVYQSFMRGQVLIPTYLIRNINIALYRHALIHLHPTQRASDVRAVLVYLMTEQCATSKALLDSVGGMNFFRQLLEDRNPGVALLASRFLLQQLWREKPDLYQAHLNSLIAKAQELNDERLLDNPYLQITSLLG